jgi:hypothetical protein
MFNPEPNRNAAEKPSTCSGYAEIVYDSAGQKPNNNHNSDEHAPNYPTQHRDLPARARTIS